MAFALRTCARRSQGHRQWRLRESLREVAFYPVRAVAVDGPPEGRQGRRPRYRGTCAITGGRGKVFGRSSSAGATQGLSGFPLSQKVRKRVEAQAPRRRCTRPGGATGETKTASGASAGRLRRAKGKTARGTSGFSRSWTAGTAPVFEAVGREMAPPTGTLQDRERGQVCHNSGAMLLAGSRPAPGRPRACALGPPAVAKPSATDPALREPPAGTRWTGASCGTGRVRGTSTPAGPLGLRRRCAFLTARRRAWRHAGAVRCGNGGFCSVADGAAEGTFSLPVRRQAPKPEARVGAPIHMPGSSTRFP